MKFIIGTVISVVLVLMIPACGGVGTPAAPSATEEILITSTPTFPPETVLATLASPYSENVEPLLTDAAPICEAAFEKPVGSGALARPIYFFINVDYEDQGWTQATDLYPFMNGEGSPENKNLVCIKQSRILIDAYEISHDPAYQLEWNIRLVSTSSNEVLGTFTLAGRQPPSAKPVGSGPAYGTPPKEELLSWLLAALGDTTVLVHRGLSGIAFSPDGASLVSSAGNYSVENGEETMLKLWETGTGKLIFSLDEGDDIYNVAFSPTGKLIAFALQKVVKIIDTTTQQEVMRFDRIAFGRKALAFSPDGNSIGIGGWGDKVELFDVLTGQVIRTLAEDAGIIDVLAFSEDGSILAVLEDGQPRLWETATGEPITITIAPGTGRLENLAISPDGKTLALSGGNYTDNAFIRLFDVKTSEVKQTLATPEFRILDIAFSPDGQDLAAIMWNMKPFFAYNEIIQWNTTTGQILQTRTENINEYGIFGVLAYSPDGRFLASASSDFTIKIWDLVSGR